MRRDFIEELMGAVPDPYGDDDWWRCDDCGEDWETVECECPRCHHGTPYSKCVDCDSLGPPGHDPLEGSLPAL